MTNEFLTDVPVIVTEPLDCIKQFVVGSLIPLMSLARNPVTHTIYGGAVCLINV